MTTRHSLLGVVSALMAPFASVKAVLALAAQEPPKKAAFLFPQAASILLLAAASCSPPPTTASVAIPPLPPQQARVWFYREVDTADWNSTTPYVRLNGAIAGVPVQGGAFYRDVPPGHYGITVDGWGMSPTPSREVAVAAGEQIYARIGLGASWNRQGFTITLAPSELGRAAVEQSKFYGGRELSANPVGA